MRKLLILMLVLGLSPVANAVLISVDGVVDPEDTTINLTPSETVVIDIMGQDEPQPLNAYLLIEGPGAIAGSTMLYPGSLAMYFELEGWAAFCGYTPEELLGAIAAMGYPGLVDLSYMSFADGAAPGAPLSGKLVDDIIFHCEGLGDVVLTLLSDDFVTVLDTQVIHNVPEPMTVALLGLGGLFLRRRR